MIPFTRNSGRGQTSLETLLIVAFILTLTALISFSFFENQSKTAVAANAKLLVLPYVEKNAHPLRIAAIMPALASSAGSSSLQLTVTTKGQLDPGFISSIPCALICSRLDSADYFPGGVAFVWNNLNAGASESVCPSTTTC